MIGQQLFLGSQEVLQHVLIPRLSAADLMHLGLTCKAVHSWVVSLPPALWQVSCTAPSLCVQVPAWGTSRACLPDLLVCSRPAQADCVGALAQEAPRDASAAYLASLPSTQLVLTALQRAGAARRRIQANLPCVKVDTV